MECPYCEVEYASHKVMDSRDEFGVRRRMRICRSCDAVFTTTETVDVDQTGKRYLPYEKKSEATRRISGQIFVRITDQYAQHFMPQGTDPPDMRRIHIFLGLLAVPSTERGHLFSSEHQYTVSGLLGLGITRLDVHMRTSLDIGHYSIGQSLGGIVREPIWRI